MAHSVALAMASPLSCQELPWQKGYAESEPSTVPEALGISQDWPGAANFDKVQMILDQNRLLIKEINQNHCARRTEGLSRNVGLIRELHINVAKVRLLGQAAFVACRWDEV